MENKTKQKNKIKDNSKEFILEFFKDCLVKDEKEILTISQVPKEFEDFIGKKSPYKLVFDFNLHTRVKSSELITKGSYFLLAIRDYLSTKGQTSLLKINIKPDLVEINKSPKLKNCKILEIKKDKFDFFYEFSFLSKYEYLNNKKQSMTSFFVKDNKFLNIDVDKLKTREGNKDEIPNLDSLEFYQTAKKRLGEKVDKETMKIKIILKEKLKKELTRVKDYYFKQIKEKDEEVEACANKIKKLESKLRHTSYDRDICILKRMIRESGDRLEMLKKKTYKERLKAEEGFHIKDEVEKHTLSIKNHLINISVFYYPVHEISASCKGKNVLIKWDGFLKKVV